VTAIKKWLKIILEESIFAVCIGLLIYGHRQTGVRNLAGMLIGLFGLLGLLFINNVEHRR